MKNGDLSVTSISTSIFGHVPISSHKLNVSLYFYNISITCFFSTSVRHDLSKSTYLSNISFSYICFLSSLESNHGYFYCSNIGNFSSALILLALVVSFLPKYVVLKS